MNIEPATLVRQLWRAGHTRGTPRVGSSLASALRRYLQDHGIPFVPFGDGDVKTASPGTYRPVGATCPPTCPYLGAGCYAEGGNVAIHQRKADAGRDAAVASAAAAMVWAALSGRTARLHVSGDLGSDGVDMLYVAHLCTVARTVRALRGGTDPVGWTYTHHAPGPYLRKLADAGVVVRVSDAAGPGGAVVVADRAGARALRGTGVRVAVCPAQLAPPERPVTCADCRLCWERSDLTIAFVVHGIGKGKIRRRLDAERG